MFSCRLNGEIELRPLEMRFAEELFTLTDANREYLRPWMPWADGTLSIDHTRSFIRRILHEIADGREAQATIWYMGKLVGMVGMFGINERNCAASIGYWLSKEYEGRGVMQLACKEMLRYGFECLGLRRIQLRAATDNVRSRNLAERLGFHLEGIQRQNECVAGRIMDVALYSLLRDEWKA